jgi:hypothetical protein
VSCERAHHERESQDRKPPRSHHVEHSR